MSHPEQSTRRPGRTRTTALTVLTMAVLGGAATGSAHARLVDPDPPARGGLVTVYRATTQYSTPYTNARTQRPLPAGTYVATCEAIGSVAGPYRNHWWTKLHSGTWVNNGYLRGGVKMNVGNCPAPSDDGGRPALPSSVGVAGGPISRAEVLARSFSWIRAHVMYGSKRRTNGYRQDCSGYVAMSWHLRSQPSSTQLIERFPYVTPIPKSALSAGDALGHPGHIALFVGWASRARPIVREEYDSGHPAVQRTWSAGWASHFKAYRYKLIR